MSNLTQKEIVVRVTAKIDDVERQLDKLRATLVTQKDAFASLANGAGNATNNNIDIADRNMQSLILRANSLRDQLNRLNNQPHIDNTDNIKMVAREYGDLSKQLQGLTAQTSRFENVFKQVSGTDAQIPTLITNTKQLMKNLQALKGLSHIGIDIETTGRHLPDVQPGNKGNTRVRTIALAGEGAHPVVIDLDQMKKSDMDKISQFLSSNAQVKVGHNLAFEKSWLQAAGINMRGPVFDTMLASDALYAQTRKRSDDEVRRAGVIPKDSFTYRTDGGAGAQTLQSLVYEYMYKNLPGMTKGHFETAIMNKQYQDDSNWRTPVLSPEKLSYNVQDAIKALDLMHIINSMAGKLNITPEITNRMADVNLRAAMETSKTRTQNQLPLQDGAATSHTINEGMSRYNHSFKLMSAYFAAIETSITGKGHQKLADIAGGSDVIKTQYAKTFAGDTQSAERIGYLNAKITQAVQELVKNFSSMHTAFSSKDNDALFDSIRNMYKQTSTIHALQGSVKGIPFLDSILPTINKMHAINTLDSKGPIEYMRQLFSLAPTISSMMENVMKTSILTPGELANLSQAGKLPSSFATGEASLQQRKLDANKVGDLEYNPKQFDGKLKAGLKIANTDLANDVAVNMQTFLRGYEEETYGATKPENLADMRNRLRNINIPKKLAQPLLDILSHTDNFVATLDHKDNKFDEKTFGAYEHASNEIANRMVKLRSFMSDTDPLKQLAAKLHRTDTYIARIRALSQESPNDISLKGGEALTRAREVRNNLREALTNGLLVNIGRQFLPTSVSHIDLDNMYENTVRPTIDTNYAKQLSQQRHKNVDRVKYSQNYFNAPSGTNLTIDAANGYMSEWQKLQTELIDNKVANPENLAAHYTSLTAELAAKRKRFQELYASQRNPNSLASKFFISMMDKLSRDIKNMQTWKDAVADLTGTANSLSATSGRNNADTLKTQMQTMFDSIEQNFRGIGAAANPRDMFERYIRPQVKSFGELRRQYSTFKSMISGKAPAYEVPMNPNAWKEAGLGEGPIQWDKSGVTQNAIKAVKEHNTRIMQMYQKLMQGGTLNAFQIKELLPIAKTAGLEELASQAKGALSQIDVSSSAEDQEKMAKQLTAGLRVSMDNALNILAQRQRTLQLVSGTLTRAAFRTQEDNTRLAAIGQHMQGIIAGYGGNLANAGMDPYFDILSGEVQRILTSTPKYDISRAKKMSTGVGRKSVVNNEFNEQMSLINEAILTAVDTNVVATLEARRNQLLEQSRISKMQNRGMSASEVAAARMRAEIKTLRDESSSNRVAVTGLDRLSRNEAVSGIESMNIMAALKGRITSLFDLYDPARFAEIPNMITQLKAKIAADTQKIAQYDEATRTKTLGPKGAYSYELGTLKREAERSSAAAMSGITGTDNIHTAYARWQTENTQLLNSIQELELKLALLRQGFKIPPNLDALAAIKQEIKAAQLLQAEALQGIGRYQHAGLSPAAAQAESDRILRDVITPAQQILKNMKPSGTSNQDVLTAELKMLENQARQSWSAIATAIPNDEAAIHAAYQQWMIDNKALGDSILALKLKLQLLQQGMRLSPSAGPANSGLDTLATVNQKIKDANNLRLQALMGQGAYTGMTPSSRRLESTRIFEESIRPLQQLKNQLRGIEEEANASSGGGSGGGHGRGLIGWINRVAITAGSLSFVFMNLKEIIGGLVRPGLEYAATMEQSSIGMAGILLSLSDLNGETMSWAQALSISHKTIEKIADSSFLSGVKADEITKLTQALLGSGLTAGMKIDQVVEFSTTGSAALKQIGMPNQQFIQELRDMLQGGIQSSSSVLATILGVTDADVVRLRQTGGIFEFLMTRMQGFKVATAASMKTFEGMMGQIRDVLTRASAKGLQEVFEVLKGSAETILRRVVDIDAVAGTWSIKPEIIAAFKSVGDELLNITLNLSIMYQTISNMAHVQLFFSTIGSLLSSMNANIRGVTFAITTWLEFKIIAAMLSGIGSILMGLINMISKFGLGVQVVADIINGVAFTTAISSLGRLTLALGTVTEAVAAIELAIVVRWSAAIAVATAGVARLRMLILTGMWTGLLPATITTALLGIATSLGTGIVAVLTSAFTLFRAAILKDPISVAVVLSWLGVQFDPNRKFGNWKDSNVNPNDPDPYDILGKKAKEAADNLDKLSHSANRPDLQEDRSNSAAAKEYASHSANRPDMIESRAQNEQAAAVITAKYPTMKAENVRRIAAAERAYWETITKSSIDIVKAQLDVAKSAIQRLFDDHKLTIKEFHQQTFAAERSKLQQDNMLLQKQVGRYADDLRVVQLAGGTPKTTSTTATSSSSNLDLPTQSNVNIKDVRPDVLAAVAAAMTDIRNELGVSPVISSGYREGDSPNGHGGGWKADITWPELEWDTPEFLKAVEIGVRYGLKTYTTPHGSGPHMDYDGHAAVIPVSNSSNTATEEAPETLTESKLTDQQRAIIAKAKKVLTDADIKNVNASDATSFEKATAAKAKMIDAESKIQINNIKIADTYAAEAAAIRKDMITLQKAKMDLDSQYEQKFRSININKSIVGSMEPMLGIQFDSETPDKFKADYLAALKTIDLQVPDEFKAELTKDFTTAMDAAFSAYINEPDEAIRQTIIDKMARTFKSDALKKSIDGYAKQVEIQIKQWDQVINNAAARMSLAAVNALNTLQSSIANRLKPIGGFKDTFSRMFGGKTTDGPPVEITQYIASYTQASNNAKTTISQESDKVLAAILSSNSKLQAKDMQELLGPTNASQLTEDNLKSLSTLFAYKLKEVEALELQRTEIVNYINNSPLLNDMTPRDRSLLADKVNEEMKAGQRSILSPLMEDINKFAEKNPELIGQLTGVIDKIRQLTIASEKDSSKISRSFLGVTTTTGELGQVLNGAFTGFLNSIQEVINGTKSIADAFRNMAKAIVDAMIQILIQKIAMAMVNALLGVATGGQISGGSQGSGSSPSGAATGGNIAGNAKVLHRGPKFATGGITGSGDDTSDNIPIWVSPGEWVIRAKAARKYGPEFMKAVNEERLDTSSVQKFANGGIIRSMNSSATSAFLPTTPKFALGGLVNNVKVDPTQIMASGATPELNMTMVNVSDPNQVRDFMSSSKGSKVFLNTISAHKSTIKKILA